MGALFAIRRRRRMQTERMRKNPLAQLTELEIIQNYRLSKAAILELYSLLQHDLQRKNHGWRTLTVEEQVLISLKVFASGSFQNSSKDDINVSQPTVSKVLSKFMDSPISKKESFIHMPNDSDAVISKQQFYSLARTFQCSSIRVFIVLKNRDINGQTSRQRLKALLQC